MLLLGAISLFAQNNLPDSVRVTGTWKLVRLEASIYSDKQEELNHTVISQFENRLPLSSLVPLFMRLQTGGYVMGSQGEKESGAYAMFSGTMLCTPANEKGVAEIGKTPARMYRYTLLDDGMLVLKLPATFYYDNSRSRSVEERVVGYYQKISNKGR